METTTLVNGLNPDEWRVVCGRNGIAHFVTSFGPPVVFACGRALPSIMLQPLVTPGHNQKQLDQQTTDPPQPPLCTVCQRIRTRPAASRLHFRKAPALVIREGFSPSEVANRFGLSVATVYSQVRQGKLKSSRIGDRIVILQTDLDAWLQAGRSLSVEAEKIDSGSKD